VKTAGVDGGSLAAQPQPRHLPMVRRVRDAV